MYMEREIYACTEESAYIYAWRLNSAIAARLFTALIIAINSARSLIAMVESARAVECRRCRRVGT